MAQFKSEPKPCLYRLTRAVIKLSMQVFFRKIELRNGKSVPKQGPVLFVANHPNSIMDALVMGVVTRRKVNYIGHAGLFSNRLKSWFLRSTGVIPVYRREDASEKMQQNVSMFAACFRALENGETIGIFPEGTSDMVRKVKKVKTGAARIVLEAERQNEYALGVTVLPIGLYFFSRSRFRSKVLVNVGKPIALQDFFRMNKEDNVKAVQALTLKIQQNLEKITVNIKHEELDEFVRDIEVLYREELIHETLGISQASKETVAEFYLIQKIADCVEYYYEHDIDKVQSVRERIRHYNRKLNRLHLKDGMLKGKISFGPLLKGSLVDLLTSALGLPLALYGMLNNFLPYLLTEFVARKFVDDRTKILSALLIGGSVAFAFFYALQISLVWWHAGSSLAGLYFLSLPLAGFFALAYIRKVRSEQQRLGLTFFLFTNRQLLGRMRRERRELIAELNAIRDDYIQKTGLDLA